VATTRLSTFAEAPPELVFDLWIDLERMKDWVEGVTRVTDVSGPVDRPGTTYVVCFGPVKSHTTVLEAERPTRFRSRFGSWVLRGENMATFSPEAGGTRIDQEIRTIGWFSEITSRLFSIGSSKGSYRGELNAFARLSERQAAERG
jgi:uncharacterized protein YndB with AHSA1/START domain